MKVTLGRWGECENTACKFRRTCAQHYSAGDFRMESGFSPEMTKIECKTADRPAVGEYPDNVDALQIGFIHRSKIKSDNSEVELPEGIFD